MKYWKGGFVFALGFIFCLPFSLRADEPLDLRTKIQALQEENRILQEQVKKQGELIQQLSSRLEKIEQKEVTGAVTVPKETQTILGVIPKMEFKGYSDISLKSVKGDNHSDSTATTFAHGQMDLLVTSHLHERLDFLSEITLTYGDDSMTVNAERLYVKYSLSELLKIVAGRVHTPFGYWNPTYHHGGWFQTPVSRPLVMNIMPGHSVGLTFNGEKDFGAFDGEYYLALYNGRSKLRTRTQNTQDGNDHKAFLGVLTFKPHFLNGLGAGFTVYTDKIPPDTTPNARKGEIGETILGAHLIYIKNNLEFLSEGYHIRHSDELSLAAFDTLGFYLQAGYKVKERWTPYYRFDFLDFGQDDTYFGANSGLSAIDIDNRKHTLGLRWDITTWNALKFEYNYEDRRGATDKQTFVINDAFTF